MKEKLRQREGFAGGVACRVGQVLHAMRAVVRGESAAAAAAAAGAGKAGGGGGAIEAYGPVDDPIGRRWGFKGRLVRAETALPAWREFVDRAGRVLRVYAAWGGARLEDDCVYLVRGSETIDSEHGCDFKLRLAAVEGAVARVEGRPQPRTYERCPTATPLREVRRGAGGGSAVSVLAVVAEVKGEVALLADSSYDTMQAMLAGARAGQMVALAGFAVRGGRLESELKSEARLFAADPPWAAATALRRWWTQYGQSFVQRKEAEDKMMQQQQHKMAAIANSAVGSTSGSISGGARKSAERVARVPEAAKRARLEDDLPTSQDIEFVEEEQGLEEDDRVDRQVVKELDQFEEQRLPPEVREWVRRGNLTHDPYHDGEQLRFKWTDKTARSVLREMRKSGLAAHPDLKQQLDRFVAEWNEWDSRN